MCEDKTSLLIVLKTFDEIRFKLINDLNHEDKVTDKCLKTLVSEGCAIVEDLFSSEDLNVLNNFTKAIENALGEDIKKAGYVAVNVNSNGQITNVWNNYQKIDDGQLRLQSKNVGFFPPGSDVIMSNKNIKEIFGGWYVNDNCKFHRTNLEWISNTEINHNGWHFDTIRDQLKVMVLLNDVNIESAPIFCAKESHLNKAEFKKDLVHKLFNLGYRVRKTGNFYKKHAAALEFRHTGYLTDDDTDNCPEILDYEPIKIGGDTYQKLVGTGKAGDCIFFESSGFHSGNRSTKNQRKTIVLVVDPVNTSYKNVFIDKLSATGKIGV